MALLECRSRVATVRDLASMLASDLLMNGGKAPSWNGCDCNRVLYHSWNIAMLAWIRSDLVPWLDSKSDCENPTVQQLWSGSSGNGSGDDSMLHLRLLPDLKTRCGLASWYRRLMSLYSSSSQSLLLPPRRPPSPLSLVREHDCLTNGTLIGGGNIKNSRSTTTTLKDDYEELDRLFWAQVSSPSSPECHQLVWTGMYFWTVASAASTLWTCLTTSALDSLHKIADHVAVGEPGIAPGVVSVRPNSYYDRYQWRFYLGRWHPFETNIYSIEVGTPWLMVRKAGHEEECSTVSSAPIQSQPRTGLYVDFDGDKVVFRAASSMQDIPRVKFVSVSTAEGGGELHSGGGDGPKLRWRFARVWLCNARGKWANVEEKVPPVLRMDSGHRTMFEMRSAMDSTGQQEEGKWEYLPHHAYGIRVRSEDPYEQWHAPERGGISPWDVCGAANC